MFASIAVLSPANANFDLIFLLERLDPFFYGFARDEGTDGTVGLGSPFSVCNRSVQTREMSGCVCAGAERLLG